MCTLFLLSGKSRYLCLRRTSGPSPGTLAELCCHGDGDVVAVGVHLLGENKTSAEHCASPHTASLLLMDMNIYLVRRHFHGGGEVVACGEQRHELMKWSVSDVCAHVWMHKCISRHP